MIQLWFAKEGNRQCERQGRKALPNACKCFDGRHLQVKHLADLQQKAMLVV